MTIQELKSLTSKELLQELSKAQKELQHIRIHVRTKHQKDTSLVQKKKQTISRIKTLLREMELEKAIEEAVKI